jgi:hypothetical protein
MKDKIYNVKSFYPPFIVNLPSGTFVVPAWLKVPVGTTLNQVHWEKETLSEVK